ncbi:MAG TPA: twin-arginine translocase TatA/TatE family subunit [Chloroflexia bacterium]|nr:twin-arginine translocase TatA/TatE family subunit [Chloroflexia bacterium]
MSLGMPELLLILAIVVIVFGVGKLPQVGGAIGRGIREFRDATESKPDPPPPADKPPGV